MFKAFIIPGLCAVTAFAQTNPVKINDEQSSQMTITAVMASRAATIPGAPYTAEAVTQSVQVLLDGNRIVRTATNKVARDSNGRVYREESMLSEYRLDIARQIGSPGTAHMVTIDDPVGGAHIMIDPNTKTVYKSSAFSQKKTDEQAFSIRTASVKADDVKSITTDLGTQTIEGVLAKGTQITHTYPAGAFGNEMPLVVTTETWYSPNLKVLVMSKSNDPRIGETTYKLTNLIRGEPDPSLFNIPADYTLKYNSGNKTFFFTTTDK
jgi:hypothetical protein